MKKKTWYENVWDFLDKRKTAIGTIMLFASQFVPTHTVGYQILFFGGTLLGGVGITHKAVKGEFTK